MGLYSRIAGLLSGPVQWISSVVAPGFSQAAAASGAGANMTLAPQAATTTGASGSLIVNVAIPASGTAEAGISLKRGSTVLGTWQGLINLPSTYTALYGGGVTPSGTNYGLFVSADGGTAGVNSTGNVYLETSGLPRLSVTAGSVTANVLFICGTLSGTTAAPFFFGNSAVTLATSGTTTLTTTQQGFPNITPAVVTLVGNATLAFGGVVGNFWLDLSNVTYAGFTLTLTNGAGTVALPTGAKGLWTVKLGTASTIQIASSVATNATGTTSAPFTLGSSSAIALTNTTVTLSAAQQGTPYLFFSGTLTGAVTIALNGVPAGSIFFLDLSQVTLGANAVTITNGAGSAIATTLLTTKSLIIATCQSAALVAIG
jgi:hypothetical protein